MEVTQSAFAFWVATDLLLLIYLHQLQKERVSCCREPLTLTTDKFASVQKLAVQGVAETELIVRRRKICGDSSVKLLFLPSIASPAVTIAHRYTKAI